MQKGIKDIKKLMNLLTRIFHGKPIPTCGRSMPTALDLNFDWGGMKHTATASKSFVRLVSMVLALRLTTIYHEIFGLNKLKMARKRNFNFNDFPLSSLSCNSLTRPTPASLELPSAFHVTATRPHLFLWLIFFGLTFFAFHFFPSLQAQETNVTAAPMAPPAPTASSPWSFNFGKQPRPQDARTVIDAQDGAWFDDASNTVEFFGKVVVHDPQFTLTCDRLNVVLNKNRQGLQLVTATGNVNIEQQGTNDSGEKVMSAGKAGVAIYEPATGDITLRIWPQVHQGKNFQVATEEGTVMVLNNRGTFRTKGQTRTMILDAQQKGKNN